LANARVSQAIRANTFLRRGVSCRSGSCPNRLATLRFPWPAPLNPPSKTPYVSIVCPLCQARLDERVADAPRMIKCPDCFTELRVPTKAEVKARQPKKGPERQIETYQLQSTVEPPEQSAVRQRKRDDEVVLVVCKV